jgi:pimeloyl-ACP methyl ester carboxylesterase
MLPDMLADLRREHIVDRVTVRGLDETEVGALIGAWTGRESSRSLVSVVQEQAEGNPFFVIEAVRHLSNQGALYERDGRIATDLAVEQMEIPEGAREMVRRRLAGLSEACSHLLTVAAVLGREFDLETLERASASTHLDALEQIEEAVAAHIISEVPVTAGRYWFRQALLRETLYRDLTATRRLHIHQQSLRYAETRGVKLAYEVLGSTGPYLIAVGLSNCPAVTSRLRSVAASWERISHRCRVVLYDRRGVGSSDAPERGYSPTGGVEDLGAVLDAVGVERGVLWGASDGGALAITFVAQYPERVAGLVLLGTTAKLVSSDDFPFGVNTAVMEPFLRVDAVDRERAASELTRTRHDPDEARAIAEVMRRVPQPAWSKILGAFAATDARSLLTRVRVPTLVVHDPDNTFIPVEAAHFLHEHIPDSRLLITEGTASLPFGEDVYHAIEAFIEEVTAGSAER